MSATKDQKAPLLSPSEQKASGLHEILVEDGEKGVQAQAPPAGATGPPYSVDAKIIIR